MRARLLPWVPVAFGSGIAFYFTASRCFRSASPPRSRFARSPFCCAAAASLPPPWRVPVADV